MELLIAVVVGVDDVQMATTVDGQAVWRQKLAWLAALFFTEARADTGLRS